MKKNIVALIGARPQIIKHSAIERCIQNSFNDQIQLTTIHSGQHYSPEMSAVFFEEMGIHEPDVNLNIGSFSHALQTAKMMEKLDVFLDENPCDAFLVYGDTNSTLAGALVASKRHIPLIHIEAGLRSFNKSMPEEINRIMTDHVSSYLFCPTEAAIVNLKNEGLTHHSEATFDKPAIYHCGDIMYDNSLHFAQVANGKSTILTSLNLQKNQFLLATVHRPNNTDNVEQLSGIFEAFLTIIQAHQLPIVLPLHPRTQKLLQNLPTELLQRIEVEERLMRIEPVGFLDMIVLEENSKMILTDSGGVQKEAYFFKKPSVILRPETEWVEIIENGCALLANQQETIIEATKQLLKKVDQLDFPEVFGDGNAAYFILSKILD